MWYCMFMSVCINGAASFGFPNLEEEYLHGNLLRISAVVFPIGILLWVAVSPGVSMEAKRIYKRCLTKEAWSLIGERPEQHTLIVLGLFAFTIIATYLYAVPPSTTGIYAILFNPDNSTAIREKSLKLLSSSSLKYAYHFHIKIIAPILIALIALRLRCALTSVNCLRLIVMLLILISASLSGARMPIVNLVFVVGVVSLLRNGLFRGGGALTCWCYFCPGNNSLDNAA